MTRTDAQSIVRGLIEKLSAIFYLRTPGRCALWLLFLKYAADNYLGAVTREQMMLCGAIQKRIAGRGQKPGMEVVIQYLQLLDAHYGLDSILSGPETVEDYERLMNGRGGRQRLNVTDEDFRELQDYVGKQDLTEDEFGTVGRMLVESLMPRLDAEDDQGAPGYGRLARAAIGRLAARILQVQDTDVFLNPACGYGGPCVRALGDSQAMVMLSDEDPRAATAAAMCLLMTGHENLMIGYQKLYTTGFPPMQANKMLAELPGRQMAVKKADTQYLEVPLAVMYRVITEWLSDNGKAVVVVSGNVLFVGRGKQLTLRREITESGLLEAVIELPSLTTQATLKLCVLVFSRRESHHDSVMMINMSKEKVAGISEEETHFFEEMAIRISDMLRTRKEEPGFARSVSIQELREGQYNLIPGTYVRSRQEEEGITMEEVNARLEVLYRELMELRLTVRQNSEGEQR